MPISDRTLSGFRTGSGDYLSQVLTDTLATLMQAGVVEWEQVEQDGMRVRAAAGASSFRREETIERYWAEAKEKYKWRASTAEWVNAQVRNRGKYQVRVRGLKKVLTVTLWQVLTHHFERILIHGSACLGEGARIGK